MYCFLIDSKQVDQVRLYFFLHAWHLCQGIGEQLFLCSGTLSLFSNSEVPLTASQVTPSYLYKKQNTNYLFPTRKSTLLCHVCRVSLILDSGPDSRWAEIRKISDQGQAALLPQQGTEALSKGDGT